MKKKFKKINVCLIVISIAFAILIITFGKQLKEKCFFNSDCSWVITNCCTEEFGANWKCVNLKIYDSMVCPGGVLCQPIASPKPMLGCICQEGSCVVK